MSVLFPLPLRPTIVTNSPSATVIVTPFTAVTVLSRDPNDLVTSLASNIGYSLLSASAGWILVMSHEAAELPKAAIRSTPASPTRMSVTLAVACRWERWASAGLCAASASVVGLPVLPTRLEVIVLEVSAPAMRPTARRAR